MENALIALIGALMGLIFVISGYIGHKIALNIIDRRNKNKFLESQKNLMQEKANYLKKKNDTKN